MIRMMSKALCLLLAALLAISALVAIAEGEVETDVQRYCENEDALFHMVYEETWEYPIVDGERASGHPLGDREFKEPHRIVDGRCIDCETEEFATFNAACGELTVGMTFPEVVAAITTSLPEGGKLSITYEDGEIAERAMQLAGDEEATDEQILAMLVEFPLETVEEVDCHVVTIQYGDVTENYSFSAEAGRLFGVK